MDSNSDSDSDDGFGGMFSNLAKATLSIEEEEENGSDWADPVGKGLELGYKDMVMAYLRNDDAFLITAQHQSSSPSVRQVSAMMLKLVGGEYLEVISSLRDYNDMTVAFFMKTCAGDTPVGNVSRAITTFVSEGPSEMERERRATISLTIGVAYLSLYVQSNFTGPEISGTLLASLENSEDSFHRKVLAHLECDGEYTYADGHIALPHCLLLARAILCALAFPAQPNWTTRGVNGKAPNNAQVELVKLVVEATRNLSTSIHLICARAAVFHLRALNVQSHEKVPTLWKEVEASFGVATMGQEQPNAGAEFGPPDQVACLVWLEWGLAQHHFQRPDKGKGCFKKALALARLKCELTGAMGKRTKYQRKDHAQLYVKVSSSLAVGMDMVATDEEKIKESKAILDTTNEACDSKEDTTTETATKDDAAGDVSVGETKEETSGPSWEIGRRMVALTGIEGEEAAAREITLDQAAASIQDENILYENGPQFSEKRQDETSDQCHPLDQAIILALCLDVSNSNPADGLTTEEMFPYVRKVLDQPRNWMIHSTGLLERSWLEFEKRKTMDRALMQIQALLDQHTTRLTIFQSTEQSIKDSAPAQDRIKYASVLVYPAQYELKRDLALKYLKCGVFDSALHLFREIELWDEVIKCYQLLQKPYRAEMVVREQLKVQGKTPYLITILGDLTQRVEYYEEAWNLSNRRYARAKRTWANICFDNGEFANCFQHLEDALEVQPFVTKAWYLKGVAAMALGRWSDALEAFHRALNLDDDIAEAWSNVGAAHLRLNAPEKALIALEEAMRRKRSCFKIQENIMIASLQSGALPRCIRCMEHLLKLSGKAGKKYYPDELRLLAHTIANLKSNESRDGDSAAASQDYTKHLDAWFRTAQAAFSPDSTFWEIMAEYSSILQRQEDVVTYRIKQIRGTLKEERWAYEAKDLKAMGAAAPSLVQALTALSSTEPTAETAKESLATSFYSSISIITSAIQQVKAIERDVPEVNALLVMLNESRSELETLSAEHR